MRRFSRFFALLMVLALMVSGLSAGALAAEAIETTESFSQPRMFRTGWQVNPLYEGLLDLPEEPVPFSGYYASPQSETAYVSAEAAAAQLREQMKARNESVHLNVEGPVCNSEAEFHAFTNALVQAATAHTGEPTEGDYILYHMQGYRCTFGYSTYGDVAHYSMNYTFSYLSSAEEELKLDAAVDSLLSELALEGKRDYEKIRAIYDYMCANIAYDNENLNDDTYLLKYTAYAALIDKTAVCQGYASLFYRLALEAGVDTRIISGIGNGGPHAWNIVKLNGLYYNLDATWDAQWPFYGWFLCAQDNFPDHARAAEFDTQAFHAQYPMASDDYDPDTPGIPGSPDTPNEPEKPEPEQIKTTPMYRLYNPYSGEHFYTGSIEEKDMLVTAGWTYEGIAWNAPVSTGDPVYRLYNPYSGDHHYTMSAEEKDMLVGVGWKYEGVAWNSAAPDNLPLYRLYNPYADCGSHHYTGSTEERDNLVAVGWIYEGIGWFGMLK